MLLLGEPAHDVMTANGVPKSIWPNVPGSIAPVSALSSGVCAHRRLRSCR
jgi:hypothetical protein